MYLNEDFGTLLDCLNLLGEIVIPLYYFDADNFGDISDEDCRTVMIFAKNIRFYIIEIVKIKERIVVLEFSGEKLVSIMKNSPSSSI